MIASSDIEELEQGRDAGNIYCMMSLAWINLYGLGIPRNIKEFLAVCEKLSIVDDLKREVVAQPFVDLMRFCGEEETIIMLHNHVEKKRSSGYMYGDSIPFGKDQDASLLIDLMIQTFYNRVEGLHCTREGIVWPSFDPRNRK